ncbi:MAG: serine/threonine protein kinase [Planctomycetales bacterium]|nr:serine/threonine protein kinase [Planctomycetales bacterium]
MTIDHTQVQGDDEFRESRRLSLERTQPPTQIPGYEPQKFLGAGAYGEVWVAIDRNTGRRVAIKFYLHRGGVDWALNREVSKLVFLSADRYVVQLLHVNAKSDPPYYIMEYLPNGSLDDYLKKKGVLPVGDAVALFRDVAIGLVHAHGSNILHCDLKPANILLDQDHKPRLADFGQSRLSDEQDPALGTLFYMAPEQADLDAMPDARWDVYALGALLYTMLTGEPPHRNVENMQQMDSAADLKDRLEGYRRLITQSPKPDGHRNVQGVDRALGDIIDRCLAPNPEVRFRNTQAVLDALDERESRRARRPLLALGAVGPLLLLLVMGIAAWGGLETSIGKSDTALTARVLESNRFAARAQAEVVASELERRFRAVERVAGDPRFVAQFRELLRDEQMRPLRMQLSTPDCEEEELIDVRDEFRDAPQRAGLQAVLDEIWDDATQPKVASWFVCDPLGLQLARVPESTVTGRNYAWRTYFHGGPADLDPTWRPADNERLRKTNLSTVFRSQATGRWIVGISTPVFDADADHEFLGVIALTVELGSFVDKLEQSKGQLAVLVDWRGGKNKGLILQHPLFKKLFADLNRVPDRFQDYKIPADGLPEKSLQRQIHYEDPFAQDASGGEYAGRWLADAAPVLIRGDDSKLRVIVQEKHHHAVGSTLEELQSGLVRIGVIALAGAGAVITLLWGFVARNFGGDATTEMPGTGAFVPRAASADDMPTISYEQREEHG